MIHYGLSVVVPMVRKSIKRSTGEKRNPDTWSIQVTCLISQSDNAIGVHHDASITAHTSTKSKPAAITFAFLRRESPVLGLSFCPTIPHNTSPHAAY